MLKGITVLLNEKVLINEADDFGEPVYDYNPTAEVIPNVLIAPSSITEINDAIQLHGKEIVYNIAIPKGDTHNWDGGAVTYNGDKYTFIPAGEGIEHLVPGRWNKKGHLVRYE